MNLYYCCEVMSEWIMSRYWTNGVILSFVHMIHFTLYLSQGLVAMYCTSITVVDVKREWWWWWRHDSWVINISINVVHTSAYYLSCNEWVVSCNRRNCVISSCREGSGPVNRKTMVLMVLYFYIVYMEWMRELWLPSWLMLGRPVVGGIA